jgi:hypothetical protein
MTKNHTFPGFSEKLTHFQNMNEILISATTNPVAKPDGKVTITMTPLLPPVSLTENR